MRILKCIDEIVVVNVTILQVDFGGFYTRLDYVISIHDYPITS